MAEQDHTTPAKRSFTRNAPRAHYWIASSSFFESALFVVSPVAEPTRLEIYDADGEAVNDLEVQFPVHSPGVVELESLLEGCKLEGGIKQAHLVVAAPAGSAVLCRIHARKTAALMGEAQVLAARRSVFFPVTFSEERSYVLCAVNHGTAPANFKCRLFSGKRNPETSCSIPPRGARMISVSSEFLNYAAVEPGKQLQAYLRLSTHEQFPIGVQLLERIEGMPAQSVYSAIS